MYSLGAHNFISYLLALANSFKNDTGQRLDYLSGVFAIVQFPQSELLLR